ncbi:MAG: nickel pincer cofactor biosynthesis protein LarC [Candidatus Omnitrophica bacterium]|nr:nickel pincer cofactor biosynthesis protein LarC [Candidatus Omnitrophota bacterium]
MKIAYFDCFSGVSGDMIVGSLLDAGVDPHWLKAELKKLRLTGYRIEIKQKSVHAVAGIKFTVIPNKKQPHRCLPEIEQLIKSSGLNERAKALCLKIFQDLAEAEAKVHRKKPQDIHFHEVGAVDSIIDIAAAVVGVESLAVERVYASWIHVGTGYVDCQHGRLPVPAPATCELLKGIPIYSTGIPTELTTPTGAVILKNLCCSFGAMPDMRVRTIGYGAGSKELSIPNLLRLMVGEGRALEEPGETIILLETNIDDMNPELMGYVEDRLRDAGALDVFLTPVYMKKNRPGILLSVVAQRQMMDALLSIIFRETTTIGVRIQPVERRTLQRKQLKLKTSLGTVRVKVSYHDQEVLNIAPEYEDCKRIAKRKNLPIKVVYDEAKGAAQNHITDTREGQV